MEEKERKKRKERPISLHWVCPLGTNTIILEEESQVRKRLHQIIYKKVYRAYFFLLIDVGGPRLMGVVPHLGP